MPIQQQFVPTPPPSAKSGTLQVERTFKGRQPEGTSEDLETKVFFGPTASVQASLHRTVNLGNYESVKIHVGVSLPCYLEEVTEALDVAIELVAARLAVEVEDFEPVKK